MEKDFSEIVYMAQKFQNDLKHIRLHAVGNQYDTIINICDKLIKELDEEIEDFSKWSFENGCPVDNPSNLRSHLLADPIAEEAYDFTDFIEYLNGSLLDYIEEIDSFEESWMSGYSHYWTRELKDNEMRRFVKNEGTILSPEEQQEYSQVLAPYMVETPENDDTEFNKPLPPVDWSAMDFVNNTQNVDEDLDENAEEQQEEEQTEENESESEDKEQESLKEAKMSDEEKNKLDKSVNLNGWTEKDEDDEEENEERKAVIEAEKDTEFKDATL